jgi:hypothetical protein
MVWRAAKKCVVEEAGRKGQAHQLGVWERVFLRTQERSRVWRLGGINRILGEKGWSLAQCGRRIGIFFKNEYSCLNKMV